jgi:hypothetical protein
MPVMLANGATSGGAEAVVEIARKIWWGWPLVLAAKLPGVIAASQRTATAQRRVAPLKSNVGGLIGFRSPCCLWRRSW